MNCADPMPFAEILRGGKSWKTMEESQNLSFLSGLGVSSRFFPNSFAATRETKKLFD
jgi:hypothetical protein